ncbi:hypothetical protein [Micromonospora sp. L32]|uniref:hypothetical protein n=1 Tax=unclassified Micromonospora TaxID=2617518 RepID=UPI003F89A6CF
MTEVDFSTHHALPITQVTGSGGTAEYAEQRARILGELQPPGSPMSVGQHSTAPMEFAGHAPDALTLPRLDTGFAATAAVYCQLDVKRRADAGQDMVVTESRATDLTALLALRLPDESLTVEACTLEMPWVPNLLLLDAQADGAVPACRRPAAARLAPRRRRRYAICG